MIWVCMCRIWHSEETINGYFTWWSLHWCLLVYEDQTSSNRRYIIRPHFSICPSSTVPELRSFEVLAFNLFSGNFTKLLNMTTGIVSFPIQKIGIVHRKLWLFTGRWAPLLAPKIGGETSSNPVISGHGSELCGCLLIFMTWKSTTWSLFVWGIFMMIST